MKRLIIFVVVLLICCVCSIRAKLNENKFPDDFLFGTATASYQIEGAWNLSGKGENIWDRFTHTRQHLMRDGSTGDIACDSYHKFKEDVALMKAMGAQFYRFSLSWSRILPTGLAYYVNPDGIRYYNELIDHLIENDIIPMITLFHWDTPQYLEDLGGFANELMVEWFEDYARVAFEHFGDRVKLWITFNEPKQTCHEGYGWDNKAPGYNHSGIADYLCGHNLLKAHAKAYHLYDKEFRPKQAGRIGITIDTLWMEPASDSQADKEAAERKINFVFGWYADPIFHPNGDYPKVMREFVDARSAKEGFKRSRLPVFTKSEIEYIRGTYDFLGLNHYSAALISDIPEPSLEEKPSTIIDSRTNLWYDPSWGNSSASWLKVTPWGFTKLLKWIKARYGDVEIHITESGFADYGELDDKGRVDYYQLYLSALLDAIYEHKVNVKGYAAWSIVDNFEWRDGYIVRFGIHHVDFNDPNRKRTPKSSAGYLKKIFNSRKIV